MKNINISLKTFCLALLLSGFILSGCQDFLDQEPQDVVSEAVYYKTADQFTNAANYFYTRLGFDISGTDGGQGDDACDLSGNLSGTSSEYYGQGLSIIPTTDNIWDNNYTYLRFVNQLIEKAAEFKGAQSEIAVPVATAYFFRAWHHFILLKRFGGVPIVTRSLDVSSEEVYAPRNSRYQVVDQIIKDLDKAIAGLPAASTLPQGKVSIEVAKSFKARVLLFEATWEKYVGNATDGDGTTIGAGAAKPTGYPSVQTMLTDAKANALAVMNSGTFELWNKRTTACGERHLYYLFCLEDAGSNPAKLTKADNKEFIFQTVYDFTLRKINRNLTHSKPICPTRKLMDMYLCTDGLPVQFSKVFQGYSTMISEFQNRDDRLNSFVSVPLKKYWGWGLAVDGGGAQYGVAFENSGIVFNYTYVPQLQSPGGGRNVGYQGRKFITEYRLRETQQESYNFPQIRLAEVMLIYAEATCELGNGAISDADLNLSINKIRARANVAPLTQALIAPYPSLTMLGEIRRERAIELEGENQRYDDLKRWNIAPQELNKNVCLNYVVGTEYATAIHPKDPPNKIYTAGAFPYGVTTSEQASSSYAGIATTKAGAVIFDAASNRTFSIKNYVDPIPSNQITLNPNLLQNPGW